MEAIGPMERALRHTTPEPGGAMTDLALSLSPEADSIPVARHMLDRLSERIGEDQLDSLRLLVSEVVSNSVRHGEGTGPIELRVSLGPSTIRVEVEDPGPGFAPPSELVSPGPRDGWGLLLVERLSARWGVVAGATTVVWFEMDRAAA
jgi:anti-sigma regulatory factor (Ser/Thr protein kinase)